MQYFCFNTMRWALFLLTCIFAHVSLHLRRHLYDIWPFNITFGCQIKKRFQPSWPAKNLATLVLESVELELQSAVSGLHTVFYISHPLPLIGLQCWHLPQWPGSIFSLKEPHKLNSCPYCSCSGPSFTH